ncbi:MAG: methionine--tRNA ligase [Candidatus Saccharimonadales bacterium]
MGKYYVTTSIPYVNAEPHIGFALELLYADVLARHARANANEVIFATGTDEHGGKIAEKAKASGQSLKQYTDEISERFRELTKALAISNNRFIRTTDKGHEQRSAEIWKKLKKDIYKGKYEGWYCVGDEAFVTETEVKENHGICPAHNRPYEKLVEENYFFKLSNYGERVKQAILNDSFKIVPQTRRNEILALLEKGLEDISVSRPKDKISWGIPVPGDSNQVMYVWFEALMNYITVLGYPEQEDFAKYWPANVQVIGKDILRFHAAIWPAMLLGLDLALPKQLYVHGFVTAEGKKMSKSIGNVINPFDAIKPYGTDAFRYYMLKSIPSYDDGDFSWERFGAAYNNELANELGNLVQRTLVMASRFLDGEVKNIPPAEHDTSQYQEALAQCRFDRAIDSVWEQVRGLNQYIDEEKPWEVAKEGDREHLNEIIAYLISSIREIAELLAPFMPLTSAKIGEAFKDGKLAATHVVLFPKHDSDPSKQ